MSRLRTVLFLALIAALCPIPADAGSATRIALTAPASVGVGEDIVLEATLLDAAGRPVPGATLTLSQVGVVGQRVIGHATTDGHGAAAFLISEFTVAHLDLRVAFAGDARFGSTSADAAVDISGIDVPPAVVMAHAPGALTKTVVFSILGAVWLTYLFAVSCIIRVIREGRSGKGVRALGMERL